jgi:type II secretory pathway component PulF
VFDAWFGILFAQIAAVVYAVFMLETAKTLRNPGRARNVNRFARRLPFWAVIMFLTGGTFAIGMGLLLDIAIASEGGQIFWMAWISINAILAICAGFFLLQAFQTFQPVSKSFGEVARKRVADRLAITGWLILLIPVLGAMLLVLVAIFVFGGLWLVLLAVVIGIAATLITAGKRKADQAAVLWALAIATDRQLDLPDELEAVAGGLSKRQRRRVRQLAELLRGGCPLTLALEQTPGVIPRFAMLAAHVGEENGTLPAALRDAAVRQTRSAESTGGAVSSPTMVICYLLLMPLFAVLTLSFLMYFIVPKYKKIFQSFDMELPDFTKTLLNVSDYVVTQPEVLFPLLFLPAAAVFVVAVAHVRGWGEYNPPLFGRLLRRLDVPNLLRNLAQTVAAGKPLAEALEVMSVRHPRKALRAALSDALQAVRRGDDCWHALKDAGLLTPAETAVLRSAQRVGNLAWALGELADGIDRRFVHRWRASLEFAQPAVVIVLGLASAAIYFAFFLPLVKLIGGVT